MFEIGKVQRLTSTMNTCKRHGSGIAANIISEKTTTEIKGLEKIEKCMITRKKTH